jgi:tetratricopeptide (TPR) repeat protein
MRFSRWLLAIPAFFVVAFLIYQIPWVNFRLSWRLDAAQAYVRGVLDPVENLPGPQIFIQPGFATPLASTTPSGPTQTPAPSPTPLPASVQLTKPSYEAQGPNNCGPATMALYLRYYGWAGDQFDISDEVKPVSADRNVNVDELLFYTRTYTGWLNSEFRVGGNVELLKSFLAAGIPVMIEKGEILEIEYWPDDDNWAGHYVLLTGYDDASGEFAFHDTFVGPDQTMSYEQLDEYWQQFNRVYILVYPPEQQATVEAIVGDDMDEDINRQHALESAQAEILADDKDAYAWFNLGMNQVYFENYADAAQSFDVARGLGLPQRMLRYQFGPFFAYYNAGRMDDLNELIEYALRITDASEETLIWKGWSFYRAGNTNAAIEQFRLAQQANPKSPYPDQALTSIGVAP